MQKVMVQIDWYTKIVLTLIVVLLVGLLARPYIEPRIAKAVTPEYIYMSGDVDIGSGNSPQNPFYIQVYGVK